MALGTYDRDERKKKVVYNADGTTSEEKADRSVVAAAPVRDEEFKANPALSKAMPVTPAPQPQMAQAPQVQAPLSPLERKAVPAGVSNEGNKGATPPQDSVTNQGPQSNVNSGGDIKNGQGVVDQDTGTSLESQAGPESPTGGENMQWAGALQSNTISIPNNATTPQNVRVPIDENADAQASQRIEDFNAQVGSLGMNGNIQHASRQVVNSSALKEKGWEIEDGVVDSLYPVSFSWGTSDGKGGFTKTNTITVSPVTGKGNVLSPKELEDYINALSTIAGGDLNKMIEVDGQIGEGGLGLFVGTDLSDETLKALDGAYASFYGYGAPQEKSSVGDTDTSSKDSTGAPINTNGTNKDTVVNNVGTTTPKYTGTPSTNTASTTTAPAVLTSEDYAKFSPSVLQTMAEIERDPMKKAMMQKAMQMQAQGASQPQGSGATKVSSSKGEASPEEIERKKRGNEARERVKASYSGGNLDPLSVKSVARADMEKAGWNGPFEDDNISVYPIEQTIIDEAGNKHVVIMSPIDSNGNIVPLEEFEDYVESLQGSKNIMDNDKNARSLIIKYDAAKGDGDGLYNDMRDARYAEDDINMAPSIFDVERDNDFGQKLYDYSVSAQGDVDRQLEAIRKFTEDPTSTTKGQLALNTFNESLKGEGLDEESEKRLQKRRKTSNLIANIGDILQGFANLAGTWYGAKSSDLTSLSAASQAGDEKVDVKRKTRKDELRKSYDKAIASIGDEMQDELKRLQKILERAQDRYQNYIVATGKEAQRSENRKNQRQMDYENSLKKMEQQQKYKKENAETAQKYKKELEEIKQRNRFAYRAFSAEKSKEVKQTPGASGTNNKNGGSKRGKTVDKMK